MPIFLREPNSSGTVVEFELERVVFQTRTPHQDVIIADTAYFGRVLFLDGVVQSSVNDEAMYHEALIHPGVTLHGAPRRVLLGGAGEGAALRELLRHPGVESVLACDIDDEVVQAVREYMPELCQDAFEDPRVEYRAADVEDVVDGAAPGEFDVVILDVTDPMDDGPALALHSVDWYRRVARALADDGLLIVQSGELDVVDMLMPRTMRATLREVFPWTQLVHYHVPSFHSAWTFTLAARRPLELRPADLAARIERLAGLRVYTPASHARMLELPAFLEAIMAEPAEPIRGAARDSVYVYAAARSRG
ncbi:MAG: methyltransferase domain-containing protein [Myxococcales bacterium]|nr:methyltransferase domain-containing protein [Myxococcales bacterium]MCB9755509.1 methyltransferase domain-containing protein [Myxococcales bacterium]